MKCNGCGGEFSTLGGTLSYGDAFIEESQRPTAARAHYHKTLCPRCQHVMKDILRNSDLKEHWEKYDWSLQGDAYTEEYEDSSEGSDSERGDGSEVYDEAE
jgi:hypothetical protein